MSYVELHCRSAFSFLRGASGPEQLAETAAQLDMPAMALCDRDGVYGAPGFFGAAKEQGVRAIVGAELTMEDGAILPVLVENRAGYQNLCRMLTRSHLRSEKGKASVRWDELPEFAKGLMALTGAEDGPLIRAFESDRKRMSASVPAFAQRWRRSPSPLNGVRGGNGLLTNSTNGALANITPHPRSPPPLRGEGSPHSNPSRVLDYLIRAFGPDRIFVELQRHHLRNEGRRINALAQLAEQFHLPLLATNGVLYATELQRPILDVFTCIRQHTHLDAAGTLLEQNDERHLKSAKQMRELFRDQPQAVENTVRLAERLQFTLEDLGYEFPDYSVPPEHTMDSFLREQAFAGARRRYGEVPEKVRAQLEKELALIQKLKVSGYFLIVWDIIQFCAEQKIMAQGRGSAANSTVCFCLGITSVDPLKFNTLFERFLSEGRKNCWPDIDIDLPSGDRRERVIQEVYRRYGTHGAAMTANVITFRGRSAAREVGKALNLTPDVIDRFSSLYANGDFPHTLDLRAQMEKAGLPQEHPRATTFAALCKAIHGLPRHLGQHSGGMIISRDKLDTIVPLENASMPNRVVAQWDKDACEDLGIIKVDFLGLGMMSVLQDAVELTRARNHPVDLAQLPQDDPATFEMMRRADTIGVFQIESRAQMATLPRLKPNNFYDLVIEVAIIRPGPIQGHLMHPYLARRAGKENVRYYHDDLKPILERTLGVPLFQEQMLEIATRMTDFTPSEAEELRRALSFHRSQDKMQRVEKKLRAAMERKGYSAKIIEEVSAAISSFALYGFPESHAISFAHIAYATAYLKVHRAPEFYVSLLNNQPMGFYSPATIIKDGQRHGLRFRPVCVARSDWNCTIEQDDSIRLGLRVVRGLSSTNAMTLLREQQAAPFVSMEDFKRRVRLNKDELRTLAEIGALNCFAAHRRDALWQAEKVVREDDLFSANALTLNPNLTLSGDSESKIRIKSKNQSPLTSPASDEQLADAVVRIPESPLAPMNPVERLRADYTGMQITTGQHPMALLRARLLDVWRAADLPKARHGDIVRIAGNVICRQRPGTAKGFVFISLEDETGISNAIVSPPLFEELRLVITSEAFLLIEGKLQHIDNVIHVKAEHIERLQHEQLVGSASYDFH